MLPERAEEVPHVLRAHRDDRLDPEDLAPSYMDQPHGHHLHYIVLRIRGRVVGESACVCVGIGRDNARERCWVVVVVRDTVMVWSHA